MACACIRSGKIYARITIKIQETIEGDNGDKSINPTRVVSSNQLFICSSSHLHSISYQYNKL